MFKPRTPGVKRGALHGTHTTRHTHYGHAVTATVAFLSALIAASILFQSKILTYKTYKGLAYPTIAPALDDVGLVRRATPAHGGYIASARRVSARQNMCFWGGFWRRGLRNGSILMGEIDGNQKSYDQGAGSTRLLSEGNSRHGPSMDCDQSVRRVHWYRYR